MPKYSQRKWMAAVQTGTAPNSRPIASVRYLREKKKGGGWKLILESWARPAFIGGKVVKKIGSGFVTEYILSRGTVAVVPGEEGLSANQVNPLKGMTLYICV